jgi:hypothetical protein
MKNSNISEIQPNIIIGEDHDGTIDLPIWKDYQKVSDGIIKTHIIGVSVDYVHVLSKGQFETIQYLTKNSEIVRDSLLHGLLKDYSNAKDTYEEIMPQITGIEDYKNHLELSYIHIMDSEKDGFAYYGFELESSWDPEHGVGAMMHKDRVIAIGLADESFNHWTTYKDNGTSEQEQHIWELAHKNTTKHGRKWWEFWK